MRNLTKSGDYVLVVSLQPKSGFLPGAGCGRPKILKVEDGAKRSQATDFKATFKAKPDS